MTDTNAQPTNPDTLSKRTGRVLASRWMALVAVGIALLLTFRSVHNGLMADDLYHRAVLCGSPRFDDLLRGPQSMFCFLFGDPRHTRRLMDIGFLPWWTDPHIKAEFMQLIPTQTHILDYWLWPDRPELMHVHNLVWFALLVFLVARFYRRMLGPTWMAGVAVLLFAVEDGHAIPAGWIANRNILITASFGVGCVMAHDAWRRQGLGWACWLAVVLWALCLCSKEAGIATCAFLFAVALLLMLVHLVIAPLLLTTRVTAPFGPREFVDAQNLEVRFDKTIEKQDLVVVNAPSPFFLSHCLFKYEQEGMPTPRAVRALAPGIPKVVVRRSDDRTLEVWANYLGFPDNLVRNEHHPLRVGEQVHVARMTATVLAIEEGRPKGVAFRFDTPLEDPSLRWIRFRAGEFVPWTPPPVGEEVTLWMEWELPAGMVGANASSEQK